MGKTLDASKYESLYFMGDVHFGPVKAANEIINAGINNAAVIVCGDFGMGFEKGELADDKETCYFYTVNTWLRKRNIHLYVIRGNHDDPFYFNEVCQLFEPKFSNITLLQDYTVIKHNKERILCVGGSISIDRKIRTDGISYWDNEAPNYTSSEICKKLRYGNITILATHDMPDEIFDEKEIRNKIHSIFFDRDESLKEDTAESRKTISLILNKLTKKGSRPAKMYYGHYHRSKTETLDGTEFVGLNVCELKKH